MILGRLLKKADAMEIKGFSVVVMDDYEAMSAEAAKQIAEATGIEPYIGAMA